MILLLAAGLSSFGHHPLPQQPGAEACQAAQAELRLVLDWGPRPRRLRALALLRRCRLPLPLTALKADADPELRLAAWTIFLRQRPFDGGAWRAAEASLDAPRFRLLLRARHGWREAHSLEMR